MATLLYKTRALYSDILLRNSFYLLLTTGVLAASGFFFWLLSAHLLPTTDIGVAATLVSMMNLISTFGLVGLDTSIIRYLNRAQNQSDELTTAFIVSSIASFIIALLFVALAGFIAPQLRVVQENMWYVLLFALFCVGSTVNLLAGAAFVAYRNTQRWFAVNAAFSVLKLFFPLLFVAGGAFGIFAAAASAQLVGGILSVAMLMREFGYRARFTFDTAMLRSVWRYSLGNYTSGLFNFLPQTLLPLIIAATLGVADNAYFYIVMMIGNLLYTVPSSVSRSLLAEGAFEEDGLSARSQTSLSMMYGLAILGVLFIGLFGRYVLALFGADYALDGLMLLYFVALSVFPQSAYSYWGTLLRLKRETAPLIFINIVYAGSILGIAYALLPLGLFGIGVGWFVGTCAAAAVSYAYYVVAPAASPAHKPLWRRAQSFTMSKWEPVETTLWANYLYYRARALGRPKHTLLLYPERPKKYHIIYKIAYFMGWKMVHDPNTPADLAIYFEDITTRAKTLPLPNQTRVLNKNCADISKKRVEAVFSEVFGYSSFVDPRTYVGECVKKSDTNAVHDGKIIQCPVEPEAGYIYQKLIHTEDGSGYAEDLRVCIVGVHIPILCVRKHPLEERFDITEEAIVGYPEDFFSPGELGLMLEFCKKLGMEYGELDVLRDKTDGRMYIVDANNTPSAPRRGGQMTPLHHDEFIGAMGRSLAQQFFS